MTDETKIIGAEFDAEQPATESAPLENQAPGEAEFASLREQLEAKEQEAKNNYDRYVRQVAESENFKKRNARERDDAIRFANEALLKDLLPIIDNLERAIAHAAGSNDGNSLVAGVEMILKGFLDVLNKFGVCQISAVGQPFDPAKHEAMAQVETVEHQPNVVMNELHRGYMFRDRLLRPTLVSVSKAPETNEKKNDSDQVENDSSDD
jgi:molecular chaperone GrpE